MGVLPPFLFPSVVLTRSFFCPSIPLSFPPHNSHPEFQLNGQPREHLRVGRVLSSLGKALLVYQAPTEHLPADNQSRNPLLVSADHVFTVRFTQNWESE